MNRLIAMPLNRQSRLSTHKVLRNTYFLLSLTLAFSAIIAIISTLFHLPGPGILLMIIGFYGLLFLTHRLANRVSGIFATFALTGFMGYTLGPILGIFLSSGSAEVIILSLSSTSLVFICCSIYILTTHKDMSFMLGMMLSCFVALVIAVITNIFFNISALSLAISVMMILFSSGAILLETSNIIHGGEKNYIRATVSLYVSLYNIFVSFLSVFSSNIRNK